jgi:ABC-type branched-subunit amino acid transport system substrate-binding protein
MAGFRPLVFLAAAAIALSACEPTSPAVAPRRPHNTPSSSDTRIIGLVGTLSGAGSWRGEDAFEGADVGVSVLNRNLDRGQPSFELVTLDDQGEPRRAGRLIARLAAEERTVGIVYAGPLDGLEGAEPALAEAGIPLLSSFSDLASRGALTKHVFQVATPLMWEARRIGHYLLNDRRYLSVGALIDETPEGKLSATALREALGRRIDVQWYEPETEDLRPALERLRERAVEAIVVYGSPADFALTLRTLDAMGARYRTTQAARIASAPPSRDPGPRTPWQPQVVGFDDAIFPSGLHRPPPGTVAAASYERGVHYLPIDSFLEFRETYSMWWESAPLGREQRAFEAVRILGWAATTGALDLAVALERIPPVRFGGADITLSPTDHVIGAPRDVGLWVVPRPGIRVKERSKLPRVLPWVPLARAFASGGRTRLERQDWTSLFAFIPPRSLAPRFQNMRFGVTTTASDPVH